jgi:transglutaminase-like putative cysteine protease
LPPRAEIGGLKLKVTGRDLSRLPRDEHQTVTADGEAWVLETHPAPLRIPSGTTVAAAKAAKPEWTRPSLHVSSQNPQIVAAAKKAIGTKTDVAEAAVAIRRYVAETMRANAGIGVLRDAGEVLQTKEGVCRDYAILTAALMRSVGIPARLASGLVNWDGSFYYHAWVEFWDGARWVGADSTESEDQISATHLKLGVGNVEEAFTFTFLDKVKLEVLEVRPK